MLCVSAVFAVAQCLSVTWVHCIHMADDIVKLLCHPSSPIFLFFDSHCRYQILREPFSGTQNTRVGKMLRLLTAVAVYLGNGTR